MATFDYVDFVASCPKCGEGVGGSDPEADGLFRSTDGSCEGAWLKPHQVNRFFATCPKCECQIEYVVRRTASNVPGVETILTFSPSYS